MSGLKLLNTVLPLTEAVVFDCAGSDALEAVARFKGPAPNSQDPRRNSVWREGIKLCQQAAATGKLVSQTTPGQNTSTVAVPLLHEREAAGVLLIRLASEFSPDDTALLEASVRSSHAISNVRALLKTLRGLERSVTSPTAEAEGSSKLSTC